MKKIFFILASISPWARRRALLLLLFTASLVWTGNLRAVSTYYASTGGSGTTCSLGSPCTIDTGRGKLASGDTLVLRAGTYDYDFNFFNGHDVPSGASFAAATTITAYPDATCGWTDSTFVSSSCESVWLRPNNNFHAIELVTRNYIIFNGVKVDISLGGTSYRTGVKFDLGGIHDRYTQGEIKGTGATNAGGQNGVQIADDGTDYAEITYTYIHDFVYPQNGSLPSTGLYIGQKYALIDHVKVDNTVGESFQIYDYGHSDKGHNTVSNSEFAHANNCTGCNAPSAAGIVGSGPDNRIFNSIFRDTYGESSTFGAGVTVGFGASDSKIFNNTIIRNHAACLQLNDNQGTTTFENNICYGNGTDGIGTESGGTPPATDLFNLKGTDPHFTNYGANDLTLTSLSPAIGAGTDLSAYFGTDFAGNVRTLPWDVGAYASNGTAPSSGSCGPGIASSGFDGSEDPLSESTCWTLTGGGLGIKKVSGYAQAKALNEFSTAIFNAAVPSDQHVTVVTALNPAASEWALYIVLRNDFTAGRGYLLKVENYLGSGIWTILRGDSPSASTVLSTGTVTWGSTETLRFDATGSTFTFRRAGTIVSTVTDATYSGTGLKTGFSPHVVSALTDVLVDSFDVGDTSSDTITVTAPALSSVQQRPNTVTATWSTSLTSGTVALTYSFDGFVTSSPIASGVAYNASPFIFTPTWPAQATMKIRICQGTICGDSPTFQTLGQYLK